MVGTPVKMRRKSILFIVILATNNAISPKIRTATIPLIRGTSVLIVISAAKFPIEIPIT